MSLAHRGLVGLYLQSLRKQRVRPRQAHSKRGLAVTAGHTISGGATREQTVTEFIHSNYAVLFNGLYISRIGIRKHHPYSTTVFRANSSRMVDLPFIHRLNLSPDLTVFQSNKTLPRHVVYDQVRLR
jgi:hypothetical protein